MTEQPYVPPPVDDEQPAPTSTTGPWGALIRIFVSPVDAFALIRERAPWLPPYLMLGLIAAVTVLVGFSLAGDLIGEAMMAPELEEAAQFASGLMTAVAVMGAAFAFIGPAIAGLIFALLLFLSGLIFDNKANFSQLFSLAGYAEMPAFLSGLVGLIAIFVSPEYGVSLNLTASAFLPAGPLGVPEPGIAMTILSMISPFTIWTWVLVALGLQHVGHVSRQRALTQTLSVLAFVVLVRVLMGSMTAAIGNMFSTPMM